MSNKPVLLVMAAGLGSRYGGLKQMDPIGPDGELIIDYSLYDARRAGFERAVLVINEAHEEAFREVIGGRVGSRMKIDYAFQKLDDIPAGFSVPEGRVKPWGTGHAVRAARGLIDGPFAVINADDYYGPEAFKTMYQFLSSSKDDERFHYCMISYRIENTLTENGTVSRGICEADAQGHLCALTERTKIRRLEDGRIAYTQDGESWTQIPEGTPVSMNLFGFTSSMMRELDKAFAGALPALLEKDPLKGEFYLPSVVSSLIEEGRADVRLLLSQDRWYGVTYREDRPGVVSAMAEKTASGLYPRPLWG